MARYGSWDDRSREAREGTRDWDRWRREESSRDWRDPERWRAGDERYEREEVPDYGYRTYGDYGSRTYGGEGTYARPEERPGGYRDYRDERRWSRYDEPRREWQSEADRPWVERGPWRRGRDDSRGLVEWEDRGPIKWLGDKVREATGRPSKGPKGYMRSDERIHDDVCERIARSGVWADDVEVKVEKREVTLTGTVGSREEKWRLEEVVDDVFGVEEVHNNLKISRVEGGLGGQRGSDAAAIEGRNLRH